MQGSHVLSKPERGIGIQIDREVVWQLRWKDTPRPCVCGLRFGARVYHSYLPVHEARRQRICDPFVGDRCRILFPLQVSAAEERRAFKMASCRGPHPGVYSVIHMSRALWYYFWS